MEHFLEKAADATAQPAEVIAKLDVMAYLWPSFVLGFIAMLWNGAGMAGAVAMAALAAAVPFAWRSWRPAC